MTQSSVRIAARQPAGPRVTGGTTSVRARADDVAAVLADLSTLLLDDSGTDTLLQRVVDAATRTIAGCDAASVSLISDGSARTAVCTEPAALAVDQAQYDLGDGPCLEAYRTGSITQVDLGEAVRRWPGLAEAASASGLCSFLAAPLNAGDEPLGALNLFSRHASGFDALDEAFVGLLTHQASAVIAHGRRYESARILAEQLTEAMGSRAVIEQAKGVHMAQHGVDADGAFALLKRESQNRNRKLRDVAIDVVERARLAAAARAPAGRR